MAASKVSIKDSMYGDPEQVVRLAALTKGKILEMRKDIPKSLILVALDKFEEGSIITPDDISERVNNITRCTISNSEIISNFNELENENIIKHLGNLKYKLMVKQNVSDFETLSQPVSKEFEKFVLSRYNEYDPGVHTNAKKVFESLLLKILVRFASLKPLENQVDKIPLDNFDKIVNQEVKENYFPDSNFAKVYPAILTDYFSSESPELLEFVFHNYCGIINIDLVLKEQDLPSIEFCHEIDFLLLDSNLIIPLLCNTDLKNPLSIALVNLCNRYEIPLYYTPRTKSEIQNSITNANKAMKPIGNSKGYTIENQFMTDYSRSKGSWNDYYLILSQWEQRAKDNWNVQELPSEYINKVDDECYNFVSKMLPLADEFRYSYRTEKEVDYNVHLRADDSYKHDAYCIGLVSHFKKNPIRGDSAKLLGPWFLTYDDLISYINQTNLRKDDNVGYSIHPRILLNYFLAYSKLEFNTEDKEHVALALLKYTTRPNSSTITVEEYSRIFAEQIDIGSENASILKSIFLVSPFIDRLESALNSGNRNEANKVVDEIFSSDGIKDLIHDTMYDTRKKEENEQTIERLKSVVQNQLKKLEEVNMEKQSLIEKIMDKSSISIDGDNSRVTINSTDSSINSKIVNSENVFEELRTVIENEIENLEEKSKLLRQIDEMNTSQGTENYKTQYTNFIASAANHITIIAPFIPILTTLFA